MQILEGQKTDETFFSVIYTLDEDDDWSDEKAGIKANPNIGVSPSWDFMRAEFSQAQNEGAEAEVQFKTKNLNMWVSSPETWIQDEKWKLCPPLPDLTGRICYGGLDLAEVYDFTAFCACYPPPSSDGVYAFKWWYWINEEAAARMSSRGVNIYQWAEEGWITITPGTMVDVQQCIDEISAFGPSIGLQSTAIDNWGTKTNELKMQEVGMVCHQFRQGFKSMSPPMKDIERLVGTNCLAHGDNPVTRWMLSNVEAERDSAANIKPSRKRKENKIDGIVAMIMALGEALTFAGKEQQSYLFEEDLISF
jgi:phage terminase large subunit-like protein